MVPAAAATTAKTPAIWPSTVIVLGAMLAGMCSTSPFHRKRW